MDKNKFNAKGDKRIGYWETYWDDSTTIRYKGYFDDDGNRTGEWTFYQPNGDIWQRGSYNNSKLKYLVIWNNDDKTFTHHYFIP